MARSVIRENQVLDEDFLSEEEGLTLASGIVTRSEWDQCGFSNRTDSVISFTDGTRTFSIQPTATSFDYWTEGVKYTTTGDTLVIPDSEGVHYIYYDGDTLTSLLTPTQSQISVLIGTKALVSVVGWNATDKESIYVGEERHGRSMSPDTHKLLHFSDGLRYMTGLGLNNMDVDGDGDNATAAQFGVDSGGVSDEDIYHSVDPITSTSGLPIYYMLDASERWARYINSGYSVRTQDGTSSTRLAWNEYVGGAWQLSEAGHNDFVLYHVFATNEKDNPMVVIMGQDIYQTSSSARESALIEVQSLVLNSTLSPEIRPIASLIFQTNLSWQNAVNAKVISTDDGEDYVDWRNEVISRVAISTTSHGALTGLLADDHSLYHNDVRGDLRYYGKSYIDNITENIAYTDIPQTISGGWTFSIVSPEFSISPVFGNDVVWLARNSSDAAENVLWGRASDNNTYFNYGSGGHFYIRNNSSQIQYDLSDLQLNMYDSDLLTTGDVTADTYYGDGSNLTNIGAALSGSMTKEYIDVYDSSLNTTIGTSWTDIPFDTKRGNTTAFSFTPTSAEITVNTTGTYIITARVSALVSAGTSRTQTDIKMQIDNGIGYNDIPGSSATLYEKQSLYGTSASVTVVMDLSDGDKLKIIGISRDGTSTVDTMDGGSSLSIFTFGGANGQDGQDGFDGPAGPPGSGSTVNVYADSSEVTGSPFHTLNFIGFESAEVSSSGIVDVTRGVPVFGTWYGYAIDDSTSSTTSTTYQQKLRFSVNDIPSGYYRMGWYYEWQYQNTSNDFRGRVQINDTTTIMEHQQEGKDTGADQWAPVSGFYPTTLSGSYNIDMDYCSSSNGVSTSIRRARIEFWRTS